jgi:hypothetical protein
LLFIHTENKSLNKPVYLGDALIDSGNPAGITKSEIKIPEGEKFTKIRTHLGCNKYAGIKSRKAGGGV